MKAKNVFLMMAALAFLTIIACRKSVQSADKLLDNSQTSGTVSSNTGQPSEPRFFGFNVQSVASGWCCTGRAEKPKPDGTIIVEGLTMDNWRFELICDADELIEIGETFKDKKLSKADLYKVRIASHTRENDLSLYTAEDTKEPIAQCFIEARLDRAQDVTQVHVMSSTAFDTASARGYEIIANSKDQVYKLRCTQGGSSQCESVAPVNAQAVRDGSEIRLCDENLKVLSTLTIVGERSLR